MGRAAPVLGRLGLLDLFLCRVLEADCYTQTVCCASAMSYVAVRPSQSIPSIEDHPTCVTSAGVGEVEADSSTHRGTEQSARHRTVLRVVVWFGFQRHASAAVQSRIQAPPAGK